MIRISGIVEIAEDQHFAPMASRNHSADSAEDHKFAPMTSRNHSANSARESPIRIKQLLTFFLSMRRLLLSLLSLRRLLLGLLLGLLKEN